MKAIKTIELELDGDLIREFVDSVEEACDALQTLFQFAVEDIQNPDLIDQIFRQLHSMKGNAHMCQVSGLEKFAHVIENVVHLIRIKEENFTKEMSSVLSCALEQYRDATQHFYSTGSIHVSAFANILVGLETYCTAKQPQRAAILKNLCRTFVSPHGALTGQSAQQIPAEPEHIEKNALNNDMQMFSDLATRLEANIRFWGSRGQRIVELAHAINCAAHMRVDPIQLEAAAWMHDIGYAFLPLQVIHKEGVFTVEERLQLEQHPNIGAQLLRRMPGWSDAALMCMQHHERPDGKGYPDRLSETQIVDGAKVLAIVDTFDSLTHIRPDRDYKKSLLQALKEINGCTGAQFSGEWVEFFNQVMRDKFVRKT